MKKQQFTLIEMLVVIAIIAVLATMIGSAVFGVREKGNRTACLNNLKQLYTGLNAYKDAQGGFPFINETTHTGAGKTHHILLKKIRLTEAGNNPSLYICPSTSNQPGPEASDDDLREERGADKAAAEASFFQKHQNTYAYFMGDTNNLGQSGTSMRTTSGILADGFRGTPTRTDGASKEGWNHVGAGNFVRVDSSGKQVEDENWPDQVKGYPASNTDWAPFGLE